MPPKPALSTREALFKRAAGFLAIIEEITPQAIKHEYAFVSDEWFENWLESDGFGVEKCNQLVALELIDKSHLASVTALLRAKRWSDAICLTWEAENFLAWSAALRGLLESAGDAVDGLLNVPFTLAKYHRQIALCLTGQLSSSLVGMSELEHQLDHFVHAKWMRLKRAEQSVLKAKENVEYVRRLRDVVPKVEQAYHRLCSICHPSSASFEFLYDVEEGRGLKISTSTDRRAISGFLSDYPDMLQDVLMMHCNPPLMTLKVLHKFRMHPQLKPLKGFDLRRIRAGHEIERLLKE